jgi:PAS domain S-box-containing protein
VDAQALVIQCATVLPIILGLVVYTLVRWDRSPLHRMVALLLASIVPWLLGLVIKLGATDPVWRQVGFVAEQLAVFAMPPFFLVTMGHFARFRLFELGSPVTTIALSLPVLAAFGLLTNATHHLYAFDAARALEGAHPREWGGPLFWVSQAWCAAMSLTALGCLAAAAFRGRTWAEKRRALSMLGAVVAPIAAHQIYVLGLQPFAYSLAPLTLGATACLFVYGVEACGVLEAQPIVRTDVIEHLHDALVLADRTGIVVDANASAELALGVDRRTLRGRALSDVLAMVAPAERAAALARHLAALVPGGEHWNGELIAGDGRIFEVTAASVRAHRMQPAGLFLSLRDRTRQRRNERLLRERQKLESVGVLAAGVAHEVNNPLAYVRANLVHLQTLVADVEKLANEFDDGGRGLVEMPEILNESLHGIERISRIVESMLRFSRPRDDASGSVDLNEVVAEAMRLADLHRDRSVRVSSALDPQLPRVHGSSDRLVQVLLNLFLNGKQALAGRPNAEIVAETSADARFVSVRVRDNGPGIPEEHRQRIFDPFFTTRPPHEGTGLGLSIAFDIVREHDGLLEVDSELGRGTCFTLSLPREDARETAAA